MSLRIAAGAVAAAAVASQQPSTLLAASSAARRLYRTSIIAMGHGSHASDNNPEVLEQEKQRNLQGKTPDIIPGAPGFNPALASESEAAIRAERAPSMDMDQLQEHSIKMIQHLQEGADHPVPDEVHDPSGSPAIQENMEKSAQKTDVHDPVNPTA